MPSINYGVRRMFMICIGACILLSLHDLGTTEIPRIIDSQNNFPNDHTGCLASCQKGRSWHRRQSRPAPRVSNLYTKGEPSKVKIPKDLQEATYISVVEKNDGFGAQLKRRMSAIAFAMVHNKIYVHLPFVELQHNYDKNPNYHNIMESFANIGFEFPRRDTLKEAAVYEREDYCYYTDKNIDQYYNENVLSLFRKNYYSAPKNTIAYFNKQFVNVAVHIRRGDALDSGQGGMWNCNEHYLAVMDKIRKTNPRARFHIYSEGDPKQFMEFCSHDVEFHLNEDIRETFHALVSADILITSQSTFSYTAALLSKGVIYYTKCWNPKLAHWIEVETKRGPKPRYKNPGSPL